MYSISQGQLLTLYGLYKQAVTGNCPYPQPDPGVDAGIMSKWKVWYDVKGLTKQQAAVQYIATVMSYDPAWQPPGDPIPGIKPNETKTASASAPQAQTTVQTQPVQGRKGSAKRGAHARALAEMTGEEPPPSPEMKSPQTNPSSLPPVISPSSSPSPSRSSSFNSSAISPRSPSFNNPSSSDMGDGMMEGILYKQRDVFKGWRPRYFKLEEQVRL